jgi:cytochrome c553
VSGGCNVTMALNRAVRNALVLLAIGSGLLLAWAGQRIYPESAPVARGAAYAQARGCVECHGDPANPQMDANDRYCANVNRIDGHPDYSVECTDVLAYFEAVRLRRTLEDRSLSNPGNLLIAGEQLVRRYHCFQCHGELGQGGFSNSGALKGYVPGYFGDDFKALTHNGDPVSVRKWIMHGMDNTIVEAPVLGPIAAFFFSRQAINMPRYNSLEAAEINILVNYVIAINQYGPMTAKTVRAYAAHEKKEGNRVAIK